jgi:hypothetical protein
LADFISAAVNGHNEVAVIARLTHGREQERAQKLPGPQAGGTVSNFHNHQAGEFSQFYNPAAGSRCMAGPVDQINHHVTGRLADSGGLGSPVFQRPFFQATSNLLRALSMRSGRDRRGLPNTNPLGCQSSVDFEVQLNYDGHVSCIHNLPAKSGQGHGILGVVACWPAPV